MKLNKLLDKESLRIVTLNKKEMEKELSFALKKVGWYNSYDNSINIPSNFLIKTNELKELQPYIRASITISVINYIRKKDPVYGNKLKDDIRLKKGNSDINMKEIIERVPFLYLANNIFGLYK